MINNKIIQSFISEKIIKRNRSYFIDDLNDNYKELNHSLYNANVLVIGGGGTIGSSYIHAILQFKIKKLIIIDTSENSLTEIVRFLRSSDEFNLPEIVTYPIDFGDLILNKIIKKHGPIHIVANFAAHKHVRSEKDLFSIEAMFKNNVFKNQNLLNQLIDKQVNHLFCVSTDKAANPVNFMGVSKKIMEELLVSYSNYIPISTARFANVAFSNGSLLDGFIKRIYNKQPLVCPKKIKRYFVSPEESGQLCLIASILGDSGDIFFPKLDFDNDQVLLENIAQDFLKYIGYKPDICKTEDEAFEKAKLIDSNKNYPLYLVDSTTSGEKINEEFYTNTEIKDFKSFKNLGIVKSESKFKLSELNNLIDILKNNFSSKKYNKIELTSDVKKIIKNFHHIEKGKNLDQSI